MNRIFIILFLIPLFGLAQQPDAKVSAYIGIVHPLVSYSKNGFKTNFNKEYNVGLTTAVIVKRNEKYAYNLELVPQLHFEKGSSKVSSILIHPGVTRYLKKGFAITPRAAFESAGRYGFTVILAKTVYRTKYHIFNVNFVNPYRFGNGSPASVGLNLNLTCGF
jgi:hypothetical protein